MRTTVRAACVTSLIAVLAAGSPGARADSVVPPAFLPVSFLLGSWSGVGNAEGAAGSGGETFALDLGGHILTRRAHSSYPATKDTQAGSYDGLLVLYPDPGAPAGLRADSFDSGGHVIRYDFVATTAPNTAQFLSSGPTAQPTFRLTYTLHGGNMLDVLFEAARPGSDAFMTIAHGEERRAP